MLPSLTRSTTSTEPISPYLVRLSDVSRLASQPAAADQAAHDVLVALYPAFQTTLDAELQQDLAQIPEGQDKSGRRHRRTNGRRSDSGVPQHRRSERSLRLLLFRATSRETTNSRLLISQPADFTQWPQVTPFALARADEFRPGPPPQLTSEEYTRVFDEVKSLGFITSTTRTPEQTLIGNFWNGNIQDFWNEIAQTAALGHHLGLARSARLFALLNISLADSYDRLLRG